MLHIISRGPSHLLDWITTVCSQNCEHQQSPGHQWPARETSCSAPAKEWFYWHKADAFRDRDMAHCGPSKPCTARHNVLLWQKRYQQHKIKQLTSHCRGEKGTLGEWGSVVAWGTWAQIPFPSDCPSGQVLRGDLKLAAGTSPQSHLQDTILTRTVWNKDIKNKKPDFGVGFFWGWVLLWVWYFSFRQKM